MFKTATIDSVSSVKFGLYEIPKVEGEVDYYQLGHFDDHGRLARRPDEHLKLNHKTDPHLLRDGDILFVGKGNRLFSWCFADNGYPAIASSAFFVIRPDVRVIVPEYLAAILNSAQSKSVFLQIGGGTNIFSIRKSELDAFQVPLPSLDKQKRIAELAQLHQQEIDVVQQLITQKKNLYNAIISKLVK